MQQLLDDWQAEQYAGNQMYDQDALNKVLLNRKLLWKPRFCDQSSRPNMGGWSHVPAISFTIKEMRDHKIRRSSLASAHVTCGCGSINVQVLLQPSVHADGVVPSI